MKPMKLYYHPISHNCRRVLATILETGRDDVELVKVDLMQGAHREPLGLVQRQTDRVVVVEARGQQGAKKAHTGGTQLMSNKAGRDGSATTMSCLFLDEPLEGLWGWHVIC